MDFVLQALHQFLSQRSTKYLGDFPGTNTYDQAIGLLKF